MNLNKMLKPAAKPMKPAAQAVKLADRRLSMTHRGPVWPRGTLVLVA